MRELWLVRHGETRANSEKRYPFANAVLTERGRAQARAIAPFLMLEFDRVYASPLTRALETAQESGFDVPQQDERLRELEYGVLTGLNWLEIEQKYGSDALVWLEGVSNPLSNLGVPDGETGGEFHARVQSFLDSLPQGRTLAFTHSGWIRALLKVCFDLSAVDLEPGSLTVLKRMGEVWGLSRLNVYRSSDPELG
jgi:alpha-ribazole phosphatase